MTVTIIAAVARNGVIGAGDSIPWQVPGDQKRAKELTMGHVLVMGRKTYDTIGRPLPGRTTVVVTRDSTWHANDVEIATSIQEALELAASIDSDVFIFGGGEIYLQALPYTDRIEMTDVDAEPEGDAFFPDLDWSQWIETHREPHEGHAFVTYTRRP